MTETFDIKLSAMHLYECTNVSERVDYSNDFFLLMSLPDWVRLLQHNVNALKTTSAPGVGVSPETSAQYKIYNSIRRFEKHMYITNCFIYGFRLYQTILLLINYYVFYYNSFIIYTRIEDFI